MLVLSSLNLGNYYAREYFEGGGGWTLSPEKANFQAIPFMIVGTLLSFLSGIGIILLIVNKISNVRN
jgi:hypothetical protein